MSKNLQSNSIVIDTGVLVELLENSELGKIFSIQFLENPQFEKYYISPITDTNLNTYFVGEVGLKKQKKLYLISYKISLYVLKVP